MSFCVPDPLDRASGPGLSGDVTVAPMPGQVTSIFVAEGDVVAEGDKLAILEAMKMEHVLSATRAGQIAAIHVEPGAQVAAGDMLIALEPEEAQ